MSFHRLQDFLTFLESKGDLHRISVEVDPRLEITEIATRVVKQQGPALLFENVKGSRFPLLINILGAERRIQWALGRSPGEVGRELSTLAESLMPPSPSKMWAQRSSLHRLLAMKPHFKRSAPVLKHRTEPANLDDLPIAQSWPKDGGRFITFPLVITRSPLDGRQNMGVYRLHVYDKTSTGLHWQISKGGGHHYQQAEKLGAPLPVSVAIGADPLLMMCGVLPLPEGMDEMSFAGFLRGSATRVTRTNFNESLIPAEAEFVLEGVAPAHERHLEGPYGDHFGHYSLEATFPVFHVERIWHRANPVFPIAVVGKPPQEDQVLGDAVQNILLPLIKIMHPEVVDLWAYQEAGFHNLLVISVHERFEKEGIKTALWALGEGQLALTKCVILVDESVNARDFRQVMKAVGTHFNPAEDFILLPGTSQDTLDFTGFKMNLGSKMILDATPGSVPPKTVSASPLKEVESFVRSHSKIKAYRLIENSLLVLQFDYPARPLLEELGQKTWAQALPLIAAVSPDVPLDNPTLLIWGLFTRFDCARDTFFAKAHLEQGRLVNGGPLLMDATWKPGYPEPLEMDPSIVKLVDQKWTRYGFKV